MGTNSKIDPCSRTSIPEFQYSNIPSDYKQVIIWHNNAYLFRLDWSESQIIMWERFLTAMDSVVLAQIIVVSLRRAQPGQTTPTRLLLKEVSELKCYSCLQRDYQSYKKEIERSVSLILGILGNLDHFRHSFIRPYQSVITRCWSKDKYDKVGLIWLVQNFSIYFKHFSSRPIPATVAIDNPFSTRRVKHAYHSKAHRNG